MSRPWALALLLFACSEPRAVEPELQGVVELDERPLGFELGGRIARMEVQRGQPVRKQQILASLDDGLEKPGQQARAAEARSARAQLDLIKSGARREDVSAAAAQIRAARAIESSLAEALQRARTLVAAGSAPKAQIDDLEGQLGRARGEREALEQRHKLLLAGARSQEIRAAEARLQAAEAALALSDARLLRLDLRAPIDGVVLEVHAEPGQVVGPGTPVITIGDTAHPYVDVFVPQAELRGLKPGVAALIRVDGEAQPFRAQVEDVARKLEFTPRFLFSPKERPNMVVRVRVRIDDPAMRLHAGVPARAVFDRPRPREGS